MSMSMRLKSSISWKIQCSGCGVNMWCRERFLKLSATRSCLVFFLVLNLDLIPMETIGTTMEASGLDPVIVVLNRFAFPGML